MLARLALTEIHPGRLDGSRRSGLRSPVIPAAALTLGLPDRIRRAGREADLSARSLLAAKALCRGDRSLPRLDCRSRASIPFRAVAARGVRRPRFPPSRHPAGALGPPSPARHGRLAARCPRPAGRLGGLRTITLSRTARARVRRSGAASTGAWRGRGGDGLGQRAVSGSRISPGPRRWSGDRLPLRDPRAFTPAWIPSG